MAKKKTKAKKALEFEHGLDDQEFEVLVNIDREDDDLHLEPGDTFPGARFPRYVIENWLELAPQPVVKKVKGGS